jgi:bacteriocin biosynthesis cyclodehydratase domain-containing protein
MVLRLDPRLPLVWRSPSDVQLGIDPPVIVLREVSPVQERMIAALVAGVSAPGLTMIAGGQATERDELLERLAPALEPPRELAGDSGPMLVAVSGGDELAAAITELLARSGVAVTTAVEASALADSGADLAVLTGQFVLAPTERSVWLRRDVPHLPVVLSDTAAHIGPVIEPGTGPCLLCLELHRRDKDVAWPAIASQLLGRRSPAQSAALLSETAALAARAVLERLVSDAVTGSAVSVRLDGVTGERRERRWSVHPECGCTGIPGPGR